MAVPTINLGAKKVYPDKFTISELPSNSNQAIQPLEISYLRLASGHP
jgi:hypothetical protein